MKSFQRNERGELNEGQVIDLLYEGGDKKNKGDRAKQTDRVGVD